MTSPVVLNLGCGTRTSPACVNIDWSIYLRLKRSRVGPKIAPLILPGERLERFRNLDSRVIVHDLRRGIPAQDASVDVVYHSHVLEHIDRDQVPSFFGEVRRVLKPDGIHRIVVPDLELLCRRYLEHLESCLEKESLRTRHDSYVAAIIEQSVRRSAAGTSKQASRARRLAENLLLGDARRRGETHQWMYDRVNLAVALEAAGFDEPTRMDHVKSGFGGWEEHIHLDSNDSGGEYKPGSLYIEATLTRPSR